MNESNFYKLFVPDKNQKNYLVLNKVKFKIENFLSTILKYKPLGVEYVVQISLSDEMIGKWIKEKKIKITGNRVYVKNITEKKLEFDKFGKEVTVA